jgi:hypothetical protein
VFIECNEKYIPDWAQDKLTKLVEWVNLGNFKEVIILKP